MLSIILGTILFFYVLGFVGRILLRWWITRKQREFQEQFSQQRGGAQQQSRQKAGRTYDGVRVDVDSSNGKKHVDKSVGEYVDYEEFKE